MVVLPSDRRLPVLKAVNPSDLLCETFVTVSEPAPCLVLSSTLTWIGPGLINLTLTHFSDPDLLELGNVLATSYLEPASI